MPLAWPRILVPSSEQWGLQNPSRSGGQSFSGVEQVVKSPASRWTASLTVPCNTDAKILAMRALLAGLDGRAGTVLVGPIEVRRAPWFVDPLTGGRVTYSEGVRDAAVDPAFDTNPMTSAGLDFRLEAAAEMNAVGLSVRRNRGGQFQAGQYLSINNRLHLIVSVNTPDFGAPGVVGLSIRPWTRQAYVAGEFLELGRPLATMRLASDDTGALALQLSRFGTVTVDLVEAF